MVKKSEGLPSPLKKENPLNNSVLQTNLSQSQEKAPEAENIDNGACITNVHIQFPGIWGNERKPISIRIDEKLYSAFKPLARRYFGSVCCAVESYMSGIIHAAGNPDVHIGPRSNIIISEFNVHRNMRERRRLSPSALLDFGEGVEVVNAALNHFEERFNRWGAETSRREVLNFIKARARDVDGNTRVVYTTRIMDELRHFYLKRRPD